VCLSPFIRAFIPLLEAEVGELTLYIDEPGAEKENLQEGKKSTPPADDKIYQLMLI